MVAKGPSQCSARGFRVSHGKQEYGPNHTCHIATCTGTLAHWHTGTLAHCHTATLPHCHTATAITVASGTPEIGGHSSGWHCMNHQPPHPHPQPQYRSSTAPPSTTTTAGRTSLRSLVNPLVFMHNPGMPFTTTVHRSPSPHYSHPHDSCQAANTQHPDALIPMHYL